MLFHKVFRGESCNLEVKEPSEEIRQKEQSTFHIPCDVSVAQCHDKGALQFTWHVFRKSSSEQLDLVSGSSKYSLLKEGTLAVKSFQVADSGIYHCGVSIRDHVGTGAQVIGNGTVVAATGERRFMGSMAVSREEREIEFFCLVFCNVMYYC